MTFMRVDQEHMVSTGARKSTSNNFNEKTFLQASQLCNSILHGRGRYTENVYDTMPWRFLLGNGGVTVNNGRMDR